MSSNLLDSGSRFGAGLTGYYPFLGAAVESCFIYNFITFVVLKFITTEHCEQKLRTVEELLHSFKHCLLGLK